MGDVLLNKVLNFVPSTWSRNVSYTSKLYVLQEVNRYTDEYNEVDNYVTSKTGDNYKIQSIQRIQCPFIYGRFLLRKEQITSQDGYATVERKILYGNISKLDEGIRTNFDRRAPHGFKEYSSATVYSVNAIIVYKCIQNASNTRDCNSYPEYVINLL